MAPLDRADVDTDQIIPKQFLKRVERTGYGPFLFFDWRAGGDFVLDKPEHAGASVLVTGANFGCGSSREGAVWALMAAGLRCVIAESFGDIFYNNCFQNGVLPVVLPAAAVSQLAGEAANGTRLTVDLFEQKVLTPQGESIAFDIDAQRRQALLEGFDDISLTLKRLSEIVAWQSQDRNVRPWIWNLRPD